MNPCPCGFLGHPKKRCLDTPMQIQRYRNKISGPLLDRIDMHVEVPALSFEELRFSSTSTQEMSSVVQNRVVKARKKQQLRLGSMKTNALMSPSEMKQFCPLSTACEMLMRQAIDKLGISARAYHRIVKIARTIADLSEEERIEKNHLMEAISFRSWEQK
jgi:magnesium chelatase family protein